MNCNDYTIKMWYINVSITINEFYVDEIGSDRPPALVLQAYTGFDTCPASQVLLAMVALMFSLFQTK
jgi:hypothetical protein